ncbi:hypothetical protein HPB47_016381 [Ixodes persulcatus]|uniref:Uncharacterized protein n=1 Tax=Ixodes persulcatus TaxID=34615 RepID=A0AC60QUQ3_IXOPE|nr:hypothetical protein HPB47_016381 [Ixodes persulcatus]
MANLLLKNATKLRDTTFLSEKILKLLVPMYFAIVRPLWRRLSRWRAVATIVAIWTGSALLSLPTLLYSRTKSYRYADHSVRTVCMLVWPDGLPYASYTDYL